eukprot:9056119-Karenia_brevis.AAC.1
MSIRNLQMVGDPKPLGVEIFQIKDNSKVLLEMWLCLECASYLCVLHRILPRSLIQIIIAIQ